MDILGLLSIKPKKHKLDHAIENLFKIDGIQHFKFKDISQTKCMRMVMANDFYNELSMRCTREYLQDHVKAVDAILGNSKQINIGQLAKLNLQLQERLDMVYDSDIIYKIASIIIIDENESPYEYDDLYSKEKIERFKEYAKKEGDFFFGKLFRIITGTKDISDTALATFMKVGEKVNHKHLEFISTILHKSREMNGLAST